ncbi:hypothetical protein P9Z59_13575 [Bacillus thuringiensis]|uniref:Uncharacterized protein n=4 Tax=Bacillus cereus group TaxID=86661 RepID=A0A9W3ZYF1_BACTO|nr:MULTISPECIES: hypothetical protein [Bacillus cereus group]AMR06458.1 hypothetical protein AXW78_29600 [Bacillus thuringiensis]AYF85009.1 hypothetical protein D7J84_28730 [Bacillus thuringiensis]KAB1367983.1 hypothetical protein FPG89_25150 [Bacillus thuringiensis]KXY30095.1 hypothetical protein AT268_17470 [Bacillus cereus]MDA2524980.1 hypothetical protein [Bacillus cereus]
MDEHIAIKEWHRIYRLFIISQLYTTLDDQSFLLGVADEFYEFYKKIESGEIKIDEYGQLIE